MSVDTLRQNFSFLEAPQFRSSQSLVDPMMVRLEIHSGLLHGQASAVDDSTHLASINDSRRGYPSWCFARSAAPSEFRYDVIKRAFPDILYCGISTWPAAMCRAQVKKKKKTLEQEFQTQAWNSPKRFSSFLSRFPLPLSPSLRIRLFCLIAITRSVSAMAAANTERHAELFVGNLPRYTRAVELQTVLAANTVKVGVLL